jgi:hypothetical protein
MIRTDEEAAEVFAQLARKDVDPEVFWANLGWDFAMIRKIGKLGAEMYIGPDDILAAMQMGAALAMEGLAAEKDSEEIEI